MLGSEVWAVRLPKDRIVQFRLGQQALETGVLLFEFLEPPGLIDLQPAVLLPPLEVRGLGDARQLAHARHRVALAQLHVRVLQLVDDFFRRMPFPAHGLDPLDPARSVKLRVACVEGERSGSRQPSAGGDGYYISWVRTVGGDT